MNRKLKEKCLEALHNFVLEASNENKMELHLSFEDIPDREKETVLGMDLNQILSRIIRDNDHPDDFLSQLKNQFFS